MKLKWQDPVYRAERSEASRLAQEKRRGEPGGRLGVPDGMRKAQADELNNEARESAKQTMADLEKAGVLADDTDAAKEALEATLTIMRSPGDKKVRLQAAGQVLAYTKSKPASKSELTVNKAEEWLAAVATANDGSNEGETSPN